MQKPALPMLALLIGAVLAGCASDGDDASTGAGADEPAAQFSEDRGRGNITVDVPTLPTEPPAPGERTADAAPVWRLGEWWEYEIFDVFTNEWRTATRVVAGTEHGNYLVGFPIDDFSNEVMVLHTPAYGDVLPDLSYDAHDVPFVPLKFPLEEGLLWETAWEAPGSTSDILVEAVTETEVHLTVAATGSGGLSGTFVYDIEMGEIREFNTGYATYRIIDHGYGFQGDVRVPHAHDLVFFHGRIGPAHGFGIINTLNNGDPTGLADVRLPIEEITVGEGYDRLSFAIIFSDVPMGLVSSLANQAAGTSSPVGATAALLRATAPDGTLYEETFLPIDGPSKLTFFGHEEPAGTWQMEVVNAGGSVALLEGIGYHSIDIELPSGCVLASKNAGHHGSLCDADRESQGLPE